MEIQIKEVDTMLFASKEKGQGLVECVLILVLVAVVVIVFSPFLAPLLVTFSAILLVIYKPYRVPLVNFYYLPGVSNDTFKI